MEAGIVTPEELKMRLKTIFQRSAMTFDEFAKSIGISSPTLRKAMKGERLDNKRTGILLQYVERKEAERAGQLKTSI